MALKSKALRLLDRDWETKCAALTLLESRPNILVANWGEITKVYLQTFFV